MPSGLLVRFTSRDISFTIPCQYGVSSLFFLQNCTLFAAVSMPTVPFSSCRTARYLQQLVCRQFPFLPAELHAIFSSQYAVSSLFFLKNCTLLAALLKHVATYSMQETALNIILYRSCWCGSRYILSCVMNWLRRCLIVCCYLGQVWRSYRL